MPGKPLWRRRRAQPFVYQDELVRLACGHTTDGGPTVVFSTGRRLYSCPHGCGLQEPKPKVAA